MDFTRKFLRRAAIVPYEAEQLVPGVSFMRRTHRVLPLFTALFGLALWLNQGCDKNPVGILDPYGFAPELLSASVTPDSVYLDALTPSAGTYSASVVITASVRDTNGSLSSVVATLTRHGEPEPYAQVELRDDGVAPDGTAHDGIFSGRADITLTRSQAGSHTVQIWATDSKGYRSRQLNLPLRFGIANSPPSIGIPSTRSSVSGVDSIYISFFLPVSDSNGLGTVSSVTVRFRNAVDTSSHRLYDDGQAGHSDFFPGDGIFSGSFWVIPTGLPDSLAFVFSAVDDQGSVSSLIKGYHVNHPPSIVRLNVPSVIVRPGSGSIPVYFYATVTDPDGWSDIDSVYFRNFSSSTPTSIQMYDDGDLAVHGDSVARDWTFSRIVFIDATNSPGQKYFHFYVVDKEGASATIIDTINVE